MRASAAVFVMSLMAGAAMADEATKPDYSRPTLIRIFSVDTTPPKPEPPVRFRVGAVDFRALGTSWRFVYLPIMMPLSGTRLGVTNEIPDPFSLTHTPIATSPRVMRAERRAINSELRRIEQTEKEKQKRAKVKVNVKTD